MPGKTPITKPIAEKFLKHYSVLHSTVATDDFIVKETLLGGAASSGNPESLGLTLKKVRNVIKSSAIHVVGEKTVKNDHVIPDHKFPQVSTFGLLAEKFQLFLNSLISRKLLLRSQIPSPNNTLN